MTDDTHFVLAKLCFLFASKTQEDISNNREPLSRWNPGFMSKDDENASVDQIDIKEEKTKIEDKL